MALTSRASFRPALASLVPFGLLVPLVLPAACGERDTSIGAYVPATGGANAGGAGGEGGSPPWAGYFEAEEGQLSGDFVVGSSSAASAGAFLVSSVDVATPDAPGSGRARYAFTLEQADEFVIWGRLHGPDPGHSRFFVRVDDGLFVPWRLTTGEAWFWDDMHEDVSYGQPLVFALSAGAHTLELANSETQAELDRIYITARGDMPPGNTTACNPPHSVEMEGGCIRACGTYGNTSCLPAACEGRPLYAVYDCEVCCTLD